MKPNMKTGKTTNKTSWKKGLSANPDGRPNGYVHPVVRLLTAWDTITKTGVNPLEKAIECALQVTDPAEACRSWILIAQFIFPKPQYRVSDETPDNLDNPNKAAARELLRQLEIKALEVCERKLNRRGDPSRLDDGSSEIQAPSSAT